MCKQKRNRFLIGKDDNGDVKIIMTGTFSLSDIRYWSGFYEVIVKGTRKSQEYCWQVLRTKVIEKDPEPCSAPGVGNPPKNKINHF